MEGRELSASLERKGAQRDALRGQQQALHMAFLPKLTAQEAAEAGAAAFRAEARELKSSLERVGAERDALRGRVADAELADHAATLRLSELRQLYSGWVACDPAKAMLPKVFRRQHFSCRQVCSFMAHVYAQHAARGRLPRWPTTLPRCASPSCGSSLACGCPAHSRVGALHTCGCPAHS